MERIPTQLRDFLEIPYDQLEEMNGEAKQARLNRVSADRLREQRTRYLMDERRIKAVTVCFSDLEGRFHMLDYDKKFLLKSLDSLTFDGSSVRGYSTQNESDLRLEIDWSTFYWLPADVFGPGKVLVFAEVLTRDGRLYPSDMRGQLHAYGDALREKQGIVCNVAPEIEGFLFKGRYSEQQYVQTPHFELVSIGGYFHSLPGDSLRAFIDSAAEVQRAMAFGNEKDHPEVAPSQFEMNFSYSEALVCADEVQLYKLLCRQVASNMGMTASFLPKPLIGMNGSGMHTNLSFAKDGRNLFWDSHGKDRLSEKGWEVADRILSSADALCLILNPSVNAYRRLDPAFEAPNQIKISANNRGAMLRIPMFNEKSARIEVRSVAPDANPYLVFYGLIRTALEGPMSSTDESKRRRTRFLPDHIDDAIRLFKGSRYLNEMLGETIVGKYAELKQMQADRCPRALGTQIKIPEIQFHHEVTNQYLWGMF